VQTTALSRDTSRSGTDLLRCLGSHHDERLCHQRQRGPWPRGARRQHCAWSSGQESCRRPLQVGRVPYRSPHRECSLLAIFISRVSFCRMGMTSSYRGARRGSAQHNVSPGNPIVHGRMQPEASAHAADTPGRNGGRVHTLDTTVDMVAGLFQSASEEGCAIVRTTLK
jgi:hypothetical protein